MNMRNSAHAKGNNKKRKGNRVCDGMLSSVSKWSEQQTKQKQHTMCTGKEMD